MSAEVPSEFRNFPIHTQGDLAAVEVQKKGEAFGIVLPFYDGVAVTWRDLNYYFSEDLPDPRLLAGENVCEVGAGLSPYALLVPHITVIERVPYGDLSSFLYQVSTETEGAISQSARFLAGVAEKYASSPNVTLLQGRVEDFAPNYRGKFDRVISFNVIRNYPILVRRKIAATIQSLGKTDATYHVTP